MNAFSLCYKLFNIIKNIFLSIKGLWKTILSGSALVCRGGTAFSATGLSYHICKYITLYLIWATEESQLPVTNDTTHKNFQATAFSQYVPFVFHLVFKAQKGKTTGLLSPMYTWQSGRRNSTSTEKLNWYWRRKRSVHWLSPQVSVHLVSPPQEQKLFILWKLWKVNATEQWFKNSFWLCNSFFH